MIRTFPGTVAVVAFVLARANAQAATASCSTVAACIFGANASSGYGIEGTSSKNDGIVGATKQNATSPSTGKAGVSGYDDSTNANTDNSGVYGTSPYGDGVQGKAAAGYGVVGTLLNNPSQIPKAGVAGYDDTRGGHYTTNSGVYGAASNLGNGVQGVAKNGIGVFGIATAPNAIGAYAWNTNSAGGVGLVANVVAGSAIEALAPSQSRLFAGYSGGAETATLTGAGDLTLAGSLTTNGSPAFRTTDSSGSQVVAYGARTTTSTLEDTGEASLVDGASYVLLEPEFARAIDRHSRYVVLVTPEGDSRGLYTANQSMQGFAVRENSGGRSTLRFAYRIVAHPLDDARNLRLPPARMLPNQLGTLPKALLVPALPKNSGVGPAL